MLARPPSDQDDAWGLGQNCHRVCVPDSSTVSNIAYLCNDMIHGKYAMKIEYNTKDNGNAPRRFNSACVGLCPS
jgi:hypothetical protein